MKSTGPVEMEPQVSRVLADVILRPLLLMFDGSWCLRKVPKDWMKANVTHLQKRQLGGLEKYKPASLIFIPRKLMEQLFLESIARHMKEDKIM